MTPARPRLTPPVASETIFQGGILIIIFSGVALMKRSLGHAVIGSLAVAFAGIAAATAAQDPANVIKYRQMVMTSIGAHIGAIVTVIKGEVSFTGHVAKHARALHAASLMIPDIFPPGTDVGETRAKPDIWQNWAKFEAAYKALQREAEELARVADSGDMAAVGAQLQNVGKACGGCHKPFRKEKK